MGGQVTFERRKVAFRSLFGGKATLLGENLVLGEK